MSNYRKITINYNKIKAFPPLLKNEMDSIAKEQKYDHIWSSNAIEGSSFIQV